MGSIIGSGGISGDSCFGWSSAAIIALLGPTASQLVDLHPTTDISVASGSCSLLAAVKSDQTVTHDMQVTVTLSIFDPQHPASGEQPVSYETIKAGDADFSPQPVSGIGDEAFSWSDTRQNYLHQYALVARHADRTGVAEVDWMTSDASDYAGWDAVATVATGWAQQLLAAMVAGGLASTDTPLNR